MNRLMKLILSPGAYMVWHALGNPEEWRTDGSDRLPNICHLPTATWFYCMGPFDGGFFFDWYDNSGGRKMGALGALDRHLVWIRASRVVMNMQRKSCAKHDLFVRMTQLQKETT